MSWFEDLGPIRDCNVAVNERSYSSWPCRPRARSVRARLELLIKPKAEADRLGTTDPLTGFLNRRAFHEAAVGSKRASWRVIVDIDRFKRVNGRVWAC